GGTVSIQALFLAGYLPGFLIGLALILLSGGIAKRRGYPKEKAVPWRLGLRIAGGAVPALLTPLIIILPIAFGWVPAHHAAAIAVVWSALVSTFVYRTLPVAGYSQVLRRAARTSGLVMILIGAAAAFAESLAYLHVPARLASLLGSLTGSQVALLLMVNVVLLALGAMMDMAPLIVIVTPILLPFAESLGMHPVQFGIVLLLNLAIGLCTPPVGSTLFVGCAIGDVSIESASRGLLPFYVAMIAVLLLVTFVPAISLWLPTLVGGG
ncbi:MAG: TRAP transporter large permease, partial [Acidobacteriota bacterium]|nr:TRAP transporter large permease [Acidobacteriota bacterium]